MSEFWLKSALRDEGVTQVQLADALGMSAASANPVANGQRPIKPHEISTIAALLGWDVAKVAERVVGSQVEVPGPQTKRRSKNMVSVLELNTEVGAGGVAVDDHEYAVNSWEMPGDFLRYRLSGSASDARILRVKGDSMEPDIRSGDRLLIDTTDKTPSPPGIFVVFDGFDLTVKQVELLPYSKPPKVKLTPRNQNYSSYELELSDVDIQGRVAGLWKWT